MLWLRQWTQMQALVVVSIVYLSQRLNIIKANSCAGLLPVLLFTEPTTSQHPVCQTNVGAAVAVLALVVVRCCIPRRQAYSCCCFLESIFKVIGNALGAARKYSYQSVLLPHLPRHSCRCTEGVARLWSTLLCNHFSPFEPLYLMSLLCLGAHLGLLRLE